MDQNIQILLYFGGLALIGALATIAVLVVARRDNANKDRHKRLRKRPEDEIVAAPRPAQVQVVWAGEGMPLIWKVEGETYTHPDRISSPEHRAVMEQFIRQLGESLPSLLAGRPVPAGARPRQAPKAAIPAPPSVAEPAVVSAEAATPSQEAVTEATAEDTTEREVAEVIPDDPTPEMMDASAAEGEKPAELEAREGSDESAEEPTSEGDADVFVETPVPPPPSERAPGRRPRTYEEMMELPFLERLKASFFGPRDEQSVAERLDQAERNSLPTLPKVDDLNTILQSRLARLSNPPVASIRPNPQGLLEIIVDGKIYERIDDVPHEEVRETMREAVRLWEKGID